MSFMPKDVSKLSVSQLKELLRLADQYKKQEAAQQAAAKKKKEAADKIKRAEAAKIAKLKLKNELKLKEQRNKALKLLTNDMFTLMTMADDTATLEIKYGSSSIGYEQLKTLSEVLQTTDINVTAVDSGDNYGTYDGYDPIQTIYISDIDWEKLDNV